MSSLPTILTGAVAAIISVGVRVAQNEQYKHYRKNSGAWMTGEQRLKSAYTTYASAPVRKPSDIGTFVGGAALFVAGVTTAAFAISKAAKR